MTKPTLAARVSTAPLTSAAFAPFGDVIVHMGDLSKRYLAVPFERDPAAVEPRLWVTRVLDSVSLPLKVERLERHPYSAQTFIPLRATPYLVVVTCSDSRDLPDLDAVHAFIAEPHQGVCYRPGIWHHRLTALAAPAEFAVLMSMTRHNNDDQFHDLSSPLQVIDPVSLGGQRHGRE
jgi:ureidoglycolate lyase